MTRFRFLLSALLSAVALARPAAADEAKPARPNILFIYTDDQSHRTCSCYPEAYEWARTPNIDKLAQRGMRFAVSYMGTWCMPSRATMLTGRHAYGIESMRSEGKYPGSTYDPAQCPFWPGVFRRLGYFTGQIGKWHTGTDAGFGRDWDFQKVWNRPKHPDNAFFYYEDQLISTNGGKEELTKGYATDNYTRWAVDFIKGKDRPRDRPWFLWVCYGGTHAPHTPAARHKNLYPGVKVPIPADIFPPRLGKPDYVQKIDTWVKNNDGQPVMKKGKQGEKTLHDWVRMYQQCAASVDEGVGELLKALEESGQIRNTLVVFTSDQGLAWGQHGFNHKLAPYDANLRSPLIFSMPGTIPEGKVCKTPVGGVDMAPTFFAFAGQKPPWEMHGHDLTPLLKNPDTEWKHPVLMIHTYDKFGSDTLRIPEKGDRHGGVPWWVFLRQGRYKYIRTLEAGEIEELYDVQTDPEELTNLALQPKYHQGVVQMREATLAEMRRTGAKMVANLPPVAELKR